MISGLVIGICINVIFIVYIGAAALMIMRCVDDEEETVERTTTRFYFTDAQWYGQIFLGGDGWEIQFQKEWPLLCQNGLKWLWMLQRVVQIPSRCYQIQNFFHKRICYCINFSIWKTAYFKTKVPSGSLVEVIHSIFLEAWFC